MANTAVSVDTSSSLGSREIYISKSALTKWGSTAIATMHIELICLLEDYERYFGGMDDVDQDKGLTKTQLIEKMFEKRRREGNIKALQEKLAS
jgi:hypothetical protein